MSITTHQIRNVVLPPGVRLQDLDTEDLAEHFERATKGDEKRLRKATKNSNRNQETN